MEHMKFVHKDPNASGVPGKVLCKIFFDIEIIFVFLISAKRRSANHPCPVCGKFYVNEGSLRKHLACHPEMTSQLASSLRMWPCSVCTAVFTHENGQIVVRSLFYFFMISLIRTSCSHGPDEDGPQAPVRGPVRAAEGGDRTKGERGTAGSCDVCRDVCMGDGRDEWDGEHGRNGRDGGNGDDRKSYSL